MQYKGHQSIHLLSYISSALGKKLLRIGCGDDEYAKNKSEEMRYQVIWERKKVLPSNFPRLRCTKGNKLVEL